MNFPPDPKLVRPLLVPNTKLSFNNTSDLSCVFLNASSITKNACFYRNLSMVVIGINCYTAVYVNYNVY